MTVGIVVVSHSAALAAAAAELASEMAGDQLRLALAGGIDDEEAPLGTDAVKVMGAIEEVDGEDGVLVLMDLGSAVLSAEMAVDLLPPETAARVVLCEAPIVEGLIAAAVQAAAGATMAEVVAEARDGLAAKASHLGVEVAPAAAAVDPAAAGETRTAVHLVPNDLGFHARPAARLVEQLGGLEATVTIADRDTGRGPVSARSLNGLITLGSRRGHTLEVTAVGPDAATALARVAALVADNLGDPLDAATAPGAGAAAAPSPTASTGAPAGVPAEPGILTGLPAAPGLAVGAVHHLGGAGLPSIEDLLAASAADAGDPGSDPDPDTERTRLTAAFAAARAQLQASRDDLAARAGEQAAELVGTQLLLLEDPALTEPTLAALTDDGVSAATAWAGSVRAVLAAYGEVEDAYLAERAADVDAVGREVLAALAGVTRRAAPARGVVVAEDLTPAETARLDPDEVVAIVTAGGSPTAHAALIARALGLPAVVAAGSAVLELPAGGEVVVDGDTGRIETAPDAARTAAVRAEVAARAAAHLELRAAAQAPAVTLDGTTVEVRANVGLPRDAERAAAEGADGVGLLRSEFLFLDRPEAPDEEEQVAVYTAVCTAMEGRPVTLRTLDVGGDKPLDYVTLPSEANPFLGTRGIRLGLSEVDLLTTQLRAALRVAAHHPLELLVPMVSTLAEIAAVRALVADTRAALAAGGYAVPEAIHLGVMAEVPALALKAAHVVHEVDLISIGTNDLTQYTLAAERGNPAVAELADALDPGVLALIGTVGAAAEGTGTQVAVCGELASDPAVAALLVGLGVRELSVPPTDVPAVKAAVRGVELSAARALAERAVAAASAAEVRAMLG